MASRLGLRGAAGGFGDGASACTRLGTSPSATFPPPCPWTPPFVGVAEGANGEGAARQLLVSRVVAGGLASDPIESGEFAGTGSAALKLNARMIR